ncbi:hypothetical protein V6N13_132433 [Hibiscus sabdariffa]|uniref:Peptidase A1 domain-containing protein n=1 Tax=Hibiscus sabdariffa TaxID=183260 RepID=A0ABR2PVI6_9ROSI
MERNMSLVLLLWSVLLNGCFLSELNALKGQGKYKLIHMHSPELRDHHPNWTLRPPINSRERISQLVHSDYVRSQTIQRRLGRKTDKRTVELPIRSAADLGAGQYFISMRIGTPPKKYLMLVDTGSVLTWIRCRNHCKNCSKEKESRDMRFYHPSESRSFRSIPCSSNYCTSNLIPCYTIKACPTPNAPCKYDYEYQDGTRVIGTLGNDTVTIRMRDNQKVTLKDMTIGCAEKIISGIDNPLDGILGLGGDGESFMAKALRQTGTTVSYCLVDHMSPSNVVSYLVFGGVEKQLPNMQETDLTIGQWPWGTHYHLNVIGFSLDGRMLDIPSEVWLYNPDGQYGGVILDTGSSLTALAAPAYDKLIQALLPPLSRFPKVDYGDASGIPEHCFNSSGYNETLIPKLAIHFSNGAKFEPPVKNYVIDAIDMKCLGFRRFEGLDTSIIGNILQQNYLWEFDFLNEKVKFAPSTCKSD